MFRKDTPKNVFEATIEDGTIRGKRHGQVAMASPAAQAYFDLTKNELRISKASVLEITAGERTRDVVVSAKLRVVFNGRDYPQKIALSRMGEFKPDDPHEPIDIGKDPATKKLAHHIADEAKRVTGATNWGYTKSGNPIPPEDVVLRQIREILKVEIRDANMRLVKEIKDLLHDDNVKLEALRAFEDVMRDRVHEALAEFERLPPETMHKFLDELYCKKIHDS